MLVSELIRNKRDGGTISPADLAAFITGYVDGSIPDYQVSALLMAVFFRGMTPEETATLAAVMRDSGRTYTLSTDRPLVDKHSTGGVGDKVSLILAPLAAACGLAVPMVSGRGLGHTGGTLDKLESIPGFRVHLSPQDFTRQVQTLGVAMIGQSDDFVPADKKLYALRDVTATVESIPLICASILSKKAASGARAIVMDVKTGTGAFMATPDASRQLAQALVHTGTALRLPVRCLITDMNQPLGQAIGNANEVRESIACLKGGGPADLRAITIELAAEMIVHGGLDSDLDSARNLATTRLDDGSALDLFRRMIEAQHGNPDVMDNDALLPAPNHKDDFLSPTDGYLHIRNCRDLGLAALSLGAGRKVSADSVNHAVGITSHARHGDKVSKGQPLFTIEHNNTGIEECRRYLESAIVISDEATAELPLILERIV